MTSLARHDIGPWLEELARIEETVRARLEPLTEGQFIWRPAEGAWGVGECLHHLAITTTQMLGKVQPVIDRGRVDGVLGAGPFRYGWLGGWFVRAMETPGRRGMPAPANFVPPHGTSKSAVLGQFARAEQSLRDAIESGRGLQLDRLRAPSSAQGAGWLRFNVAAWLASTLAHQRRHVAQALRVIETPGFPA
jgi:hypothetical protein